MGTIHVLRGQGCTYPGPPRDNLPSHDRDHSPYRATGGRMVAGSTSISPLLRRFPARSRSLPGASHRSSDPATAAQLPRLLQEPANRVITGIQFVGMVEVAEDAQDQVPYRT